MRRFRTSLVLIVLLSLVAVACAGDAKAPAGPPKTSADVVKVVAVPAILTAKAGAPIAFEVKVEIAKHWHLYSHTYAEDPESMFIGIDLAAGEGCPLIDLKVVYPAAVKGSFMGDEVMMHAGALTLNVTATVPASAKGELSLPLSLTAQACDDKVCLRPADVPVTVKITVQ